MLQETEGHLIDAVFGEIPLQIVDARDFGLVGQRGFRVHRLLLRRPPASNSSKATPHGSIFAWHCLHAG